MHDDEEELESGFKMSDDGTEEDLGDMPDFGIEDEDTDLDKDN